MLRPIALFSALLITAGSTAALFAADPAAAERAAQLKMEARVAAEHGDFATAVRSIRDAAEMSGDQATADRAARISPQPAGGSPFANFGEILQLIQEQTSPPARWVQVDGEGGALSISQQGVLVAAPAVLRALASIKDDSHLLQAVEFAKRANHNRDARVSSNLRMVSLPRLEAQVAAALERGEAVPNDVMNIAGLNRIDYLFVFPETGDIVIAGPASDWQRAGDGRAVSVETGRPTLQLDDLVTLSRSFGPGGTQGFLCTIDPRQEQVAALQDFVKSNRRGLYARTAAAFTQELEQRLGLQNVIVQGIPADSRVASVIVDADYRMKEIGIGRRAGVDGMKSYFDLLTRSEQRGSNSMDALRWWMAIGYNAVNVSPNGNVFEFSGNAIQCLSEDQVVSQDGNRKAAGKASRANTKFAELFTQHLPQLAKQDTVFADLENIFDLAMVSALVHSHGLGPQVGWTPAAFGVQGYRPKSVEVPSELMSAAHFRVYDGRNVVIQVAGGVRAELSQVIRSQDDVKSVEALADQALRATPMGQQNGHWWWDAAPKQQ